MPLWTWEKLPLALSLGVSTVGAALGQTVRERFIEFGDSAFEVPPVTLNNVTPRRVAELLAHELDTERLASRRAELVGDLGRCGDKSATGSVVKAMSDPAAVVRAEAARAAADLGNADALPGLRRLLSDAELSVRIEAVKAGARLGDASFAAAAINDSNELLFIVGCDHSLPEHCQRIAERMPSLSARARVAAISALSASRESSYVDLIASQIDPDDVPLTVAAMDALRTMRAADQLRKQERLLGNAHSAIRRATGSAIFAVSSLPEKIGVARRMLDDADPAVRLAAAELVRDHPSAELVPVLVRQLATDQPGLHQAARRAIVASASSGIQQAVDAAAALLEAPNPRRREDGSYILGHARSHQAISRHIGLLDDPDPLLVAQAAESLGLIGEAEAAPRIAALLAPLEAKADLRSIDPAQAQAIGQAFIACGRLRYQPALQHARTLVPDKLGCPIAIRAPAIWAAGMIGGSNDTDLANALLTVFADTSPYEVEQARFEAVKAIANLGYRPALPQLRQEATQNPVNALRWMAHHVADHLEGKDTPYQPVRSDFISETSIRDLGDKS